MRSRRASTRTPPPRRPRSAAARSKGYCWAPAPARRTSTSSPPRPASAPTPPTAPAPWAYTPQTEPRPYDTDQAKKLLDEAGWKTDDGAIRQKDGKELRITLMTDQDPLRIAVAQEIANQLAKVGIQTVVAPQGSAGLVRDP